MSKTTSTPTREFSLDEWIESGTVAQRTVELYNDRAIPDRLAVLDRRRAIAAKVAEAEEQSVTDVPEITQIDKQIEALYDQWVASKETWIVRALSAEEIAWLNEQHPAVPAPKRPGKQASRGTREAHDAAMQEWAKAATAARDAANLHYLTVAVVRMETALGTREAHGSVLDNSHRPAVTIEQLRALTARAGRQNDTAVLLDAAVTANKSDVEVPAPFSRSTSRIDPS